MAVRFDADGEDFTRAISAGSLTALSVACWAKISVDRNTYSTVWSIDTGSNADAICLQTNGSGTTLQVQRESTASTMRSLTVDVWYFLGFAYDSTGAYLVSRGVGESAFTTNNAAVDMGAVNAATLRIGESPWGGEWFNGCVTGFRWWDAKLGEDELQDEAWRYLPRRTQNLRGWYPLLRTGDTADLSGAGLNLSGGSGTATEDGPPIQWGGGRNRLVVSGGAVTGDLAATLPALGATAGGDVTARAQLAAQLPALTGQATGQLTATGQPAAVLPALTGGLTGATTTPALLAATLPALTGSFEGELTGGYLTPVLPALTGQATGQLRAAGELTAGLPALTSELVGHADIPHNNLDLTAGTPRRGWAARTPTTAPWDADTPAAPWTARSPATTWTADAAQRGWQARQPTT